jgi:hypothetical protein
MNLRESPSQHVSGPPTALLGLALLMTVLLAAPGCSGCNWGGSSTTAKTKGKGEKDDGKKRDELEESELEKKRTKKKEKPKDDFEPLLVRMLPSNDPTPTMKTPLAYVKPGHWMAVSEMAKANNFDFPGELATYVERTATNEPLTVEDTTSRLWSWCPAILPKGQTKRIEAMFYVPRNKRPELNAVYSLRSELRGLRGGRTEMFSTTVSRSLKSHEHVIAVLAAGTARPDSYIHFDKLLSVRMPQVPDDKDEPLRFYQVFRPAVEKTAPLPSHPLAWTTIAFIFWDDLDPAVLTSFQQQALLDWLHWGGQLVVSGPNSLDKLKGSFLEPYLPGESTKTAELLQADFNELNERFSLARDPAKLATAATPSKGENLRRITILEERPMVGVELKLHAASRPIEGTGGLVVERRVGSGRIVVTRFPLTDVRIKQWKNFDGFFNSVFLRRPPRNFDQDRLASLDVQWDDPNLTDWLLDPRLGSTVRFFTRDIGALTQVKWKAEMLTAPPRPRPEGPIDPRTGRPMNSPGAFSGFPYYEVAKPRPDTSGEHPGIDDWHFCGYEARQPAGIAAWNDEGAVSGAARQILSDAAGIEIPSADFVIRVLAVYLLVLVPLNWLIFWVIGKVEWAWVAAPIIALVGAAAVIRLAQLDIGFARSRTEVAVLEVQGGYERAHLTRYTALYSSLSSSYTLAFEQGDALALPFPSKQLNESFLSIQQFTDVAFRRDKETSLAGVQVSSNSTGMVHCEQMLPLGNNAKRLETLQLVGNEARGFSVANDTDLTIHDVGIFRRVDGPPQPGQRRQPQIEVAYVNRLEPKSSEPLRFEPLVEKKRNETDEPAGQPLTKAERAAPRYPDVWLDTWDKVPILASQPVASDDTTEADVPRIRLTRLAQLAADRLRLLPGDVRLIGWTDQQLPGMRIRPDAPQNTTYTLVVAHLARGELPPVRPDRNVAEDFIDPSILESDADATMQAEGIDYEPAPGLQP